MAGGQNHESDVSPVPVRLEIRGLCKRFGRRRVLSNVCARVDHGSVLAVCGPNGSGKSTLLKTIAGLLQPDAGDACITVGDRHLDRTARRPLVGMVAPYYGLYEALTGWEHLRLFATLHGVAWPNPQVDESAKRFGLYGRLGDTVRLYSSGMRQRLQYLCATLHRPMVLILDEPFSALDPAGIDVVRGVVAEQRRQGIAVIAGNDPRELQMADAVLQLGSD